jgi:intracellular sulfur oxidation DsrE/DsrF family protein
MVTRDGMGSAEPALAHRLLQTYLGLLELEDRRPRAVCFYGEGVRMVLDDAPALAELRVLETAGVSLVVCGTCVNHYGVADRVSVGTVGSMKDIVALQWGAAKVLTI